ncbi:hypothetical protein ACH79_37070 [Bradyrhizobium sp. CCBAU 051011]|nr:hypothetical protein ACH79_37070 [Bradyrhizobium sp. CCBAU 051011]
MQLLRGIEEILMEGASAGCGTLTVCPLTETQLGRPRSRSRMRVEPVDFYAGLRHCPLVSRWWFFLRGALVQIKM